MTFSQKLEELKLTDFRDTYKDLLDHCETLDISPLMVSDCGSHAWGFAGETSDWDVKFVYMHNDRDKYLSLFDPMQHTSFQKDNVSYDGWDIKKFLHLLLKGNANTYEVMNSPYCLNYCYANSLVKFTNDVLSENLDKVLAHYAGLAFNTYRDRIKNVGEPTLKKWFYVVRPLLCAQYGFDENKLPPLDFESLLDYAEQSTKDNLWNEGRMPLDAINQIRLLLTLKRDGDLTKVDDLPMENVDRWAQGALEYWKDHFAHYKEFGLLQEKLLTTPAMFDEVYRALLDGTFSYGL